MNLSEPMRSWPRAAALLLALGTVMAQAQPLVIDPAQWRDYLAQAERGDATGQARMGYLYATGQGVVQDWTASCRWYRAAAEQGLAAGQTGLGSCYAQGVGGVPADDLEAAGWYKKAAEAGDPHGQTLLAQAYEAGKGVRTNPGLALEYFRKAAQAGHPGAQAALGVMLANGRGTNADPAQARVWLQRSANQGNKAAQAYLDKLGPATSLDTQEARGTATSRAIEYYKQTQPARPMLTERERIQLEVCARGDQRCWDRKQAVQDQVKREKAEESAQLAAELQAAQQAAAQAKKEKDEREAQLAAERQATFQAQQREEQEAAIRQVAAAPAALRMLGFALESPLPFPPCDDQAYKTGQSPRTCALRQIQTYVTLWGVDMSDLKIVYPEETKPDWLHTVIVGLIGEKVVSATVFVKKRLAAEAIRAMEEKYGRASQTITKMKNAYGATWDATRYEWRTREVDAKIECDVQFDSGCDAIWIDGPTKRALKARKPDNDPKKLKL